MSKSMYEKYAEEAQPGVLAKTISFEEAVESIKGYKGRFSAEYVEWAEEICADMFGRTFEEVRDLVDGKSHWISIAGMYEDGSHRAIASEHLYRGEITLPYGYGASEISYPLNLEDECVRLWRLVSERLCAHADFHEVSVERSGRNSVAATFDFSLSTEKYGGDIQRALSGMFYGLNPSFYIDYNLEAKLAEATTRSVGLGNGTAGRDSFEKE